MIIIDLFVVHFLYDRQDQFMSQYICLHLASLNKIKFIHSFITLFQNDNQIQQKVVLPLIRSQYN